MVKISCPCGTECLGCTAESLCVSCGSAIESKQFEYNLHKKLKHKTHEETKVEKVSHLDHEASMLSPKMAAYMERDIRRRFFISLILTIPILLYTHIGSVITSAASKLFNITLKSDFKLPAPIPINWLLLILTTPIVFWLGSIFIQGAYRSLKAGVLNMSVLISIGVLVPYIFSIVLTITGGHETFFESPAMLVTFVLFGHWMEMMSRRGTSDALRSLFKLIPPQATVIRNGKEIVIQSKNIKLGDVIIIKPGDKIPVDGTIIDGETSIDESLITGESMPVFKTSKDHVIGGSINISGSIKYEVSKIGKDTIVAQIIDMVVKAQSSKAPAQRMADQAASYLVILAICAGILTFFGWYFLANTSIINALTFAISAIVIACPDALGLATPTAIAVATGIAAKNNILIKDAVTLENTSKLQAIVLDKTGTLTQGKPIVIDIIHSPDISENQFLYYAGSAQKLSSHPVSQAILNKIKKLKLNLSENIIKFESIAGLGVKAVVDNKSIVAGSPKLLSSMNIDTKQFENQAEKFLKEGKSISFVAIDNKAIGLISTFDEIKKNAKQAIDGLRKLSIETIMITGDQKIVAESVAKSLGIKRVFSQVLPEEKARYVKELQNEKKFTAMVGDGINDAPALAQADIGIAIGTGTDVAIEAADIVLMQSNPADILKSIELSKATVKKMKQNLWWATIYNILAIPIAAGILYPRFGIALSPEFSALLMSISSIFVATNAVLLKRVKLGRNLDFK